MENKVCEIFRNNRFRLFVDYCNEHGIVTMQDLSKTSFKSIEQISGIGKGKFTSIVNLYNQYIEINKLNLPLYNPESKPSPIEESIEIPINIDEISEEVLKCDIMILTCFTFPSRQFNQLNSMNFKDIEDVLNNYNELDSKIRKTIDEILPYICQSTEGVCQLLMNNLMTVKGANLFINRAYGFTLQEIGEDEGITRERVRQVVKKFEYKASIIGKLLTVKLQRKSGKKLVRVSEFEKVISNKQQLYCITHSLKRSESVQYIDFINSFGIDLNMGILIKTLDTIEQELVHGFVNYYEELDVIDEILKANKIDYIEADDCIDYFTMKGYTLEGDYLMKKSIPYAIPVSEIIKVHYPKGFKIHDSNSLDELRQIVEKKFPRLELPKKDRALGARLADYLILSDRGEYTHKDNVYIEKSLLLEIMTYIKSNSNGTFMYHEIFEEFKGKLNVLSSITNRYALHGVLKYYFKDQFLFERDILRKRDASMISISDRIESYILDAGHCVNIDEVRLNFQGITNAIIFNAVMTSNKLIQWEYNNYNHIDNLTIEDSDVYIIKDNLNIILREFDGYCSDYLLFKRCKENMRVFIEINQIENPMNLYYIAMHYFDKEYIFRRPHIVIKSFSENNIDMTEIVRKMLFTSSSVKYSEFIKFGDKLGWSKATMYNVFRKFESELFRISEDEYVFIKDVHIDEYVINGIKDKIYDEIYNIGFSSLFALMDFDSLPVFEWDWNGYLVESIITHYGLGLKILYPDNDDRRYLRGIVVLEENSFETYAEIVKSMLINDLYLGISDERVEMLIHMKGLASGKVSSDVINIIKTA